MAFRFEPLAITCQQTLSTNDSDWGHSDGIRMYFMVTSSGGFIDILVSGREYPPPDITDNYNFPPGTTLDLSQYPPQGRVNWMSQDVVLGSTDFVSVVLLGVNEGLPYLAGGGGGFGGPSGSGLYEAQKTLAGKLADAAKIGGVEAGSVATDGVFEALKEVINEINQAPDCRGVAFAHSVVYNRKTLLFKTLVKHGIQLDPPTDEVGLATALVTKRGCGTPDYKTPLHAWRNFSVELTPGSVVTSERQISDDVLFVGSDPKCKPKDPRIVLTQALVSQDQDVTFVPSVWYPECSPYWTVNGVNVANDSGVVAVEVGRSYFEGAGTAFKERSEDTTIKVSYNQVRQIDGSYQLVLHAAGDDGNYDLDVALFFNFEGSYDRGNPGGVAKMAEAGFSVVGQYWKPNDALSRYLACLRLRWALINLECTKIVEHFGPLPPGPLDPERMERQVSEVTQALLRAMDAGRGERTR